MPMRLKLIAVLLSLFIIISFGSSCYTTFKHPQVFTGSDSTDVYHSQEINFAEDCSSCHEQNNPINDSHLQLYDNKNYQDDYNWQYYYVIPWWVDEYYYEEQLTPKKDVLPAPQRRDFDRRDIPASSATPASGTSGTTLAKPSADNSSSSNAPNSTTQPKKRNERREIVGKEKSESQKQTTAGPERKKREDTQTKKEKE